MSKENAVERFEELKIEWDANDGMLTPSELYEFCKLLLTSLEKEEQAHTMSVYDLSVKIAEVGIALEGEKEQIDYFRTEVNRLTDELAKEKERADLIQQHADKLGEIISGQTDVRLEKEAELEQAEERIRELENSLIEVNKNWMEEYEKLRERIKELVDGIKEIHSFIETIDISDMPPKEWFVKTLKDKLEVLEEVR